VRNPFAWLFARLYVRSQRKWPGRVSYASSAASGLSFVMTLNLIALVLLYSVSVHDAMVLERFKPILVLLVAVACMVNYIWLVRSRGVKRLIEQFSDEDEISWKRAERRMWAYIGGSLLLPIVLLCVWVARK